MAYITIELRGGEDQSQLDALAALIASLGGRSPDYVRVGDIEVRGEPARQAMRGAESPLVHADDQAVDHSELDIAAGNLPSAQDKQHEMAGAPAVDSAGVPWDERIHSASRATIADGTWRRRKNTPDDVYTSVLAELTGKPAVTDAGLAKATALADAPPPPPPAATEAPPPPPVVETPAAPAPPATSSDPMTFPQFVQAVQAKDVPADKKVYQALNALAVDIGVPAFKDMKDHADKFDLFLGMMG